jgi:carbon monoxide dehydrogenase subunit G
MTRLSEQIIVHTPVAEAFAYTADFNNLADWDPGIAESTQIGDDPIGRGTKFDLLVAFGSRRIPMVYTITEFEPHLRVVLVGEGSSLTAIDEITFAEVPQGTAITYTADLQFKGLMRLVAPLLAGTLQGVGRKAVAGLAAAFSRMELTPES